MAKYVFGYHGGSGMAGTEEEMAAVMAAWEAWYGQIGAALVDGGAPFGASKTVAADGSTSDGGGANPLTGYTVVQADSIDAAVAMAKGCPILSAGGSVEVAEAVDM
ncbi:MAG: YciI family protein [Acidimicrobiia bacterium]|nr:YciI family protein [Acidimicrobiia bacterium]MDH4309910.1 YciI family protein [Acidimicrobiia bacterium]